MKRTSCYVGWLFNCVSRGCYSNVPFIMHHSKISSTRVSLIALIAAVGVSSSAEVSDVSQLPLHGKWRRESDGFEDIGWGRFV